MLLAAPMGGWRLIAAALPQADAPLDERVAVIVKSEILWLAVPIVSVAVMRDGKMLLDRAWGIARCRKITFENGSLGQPPGSAKRQMFAESETTFFVKTSPTEVTLEKDGKGNVVGVIVKSGPRPEMKPKKVK